MTNTVRRAQGATDLVQAFTEAMTSDDIDGMVSLFAPGAEWVMVATGETFRGNDQIRQLATRSLAAGKAGGETGVKPMNVFANADGTKLCWEYVHMATVTEKWPSSCRTPDAGTGVEIPIVLVCDVRQGKVVGLREYFDLLTGAAYGVPERFYS